MKSKITQSSERTIINILLGVIIVFLAWKELFLSKTLVTELSFLFLITLELFVIVNLYLKEPTNGIFADNLLEMMQIIAIIQLVIYIYSEQYVTWYDSVSYFKFDSNLLLGEVNIARTPVYPYFIKIIKFMSGPAASIKDICFNLVLVQRAISFFSIIPVYFTSKFLIKNQNIRNFFILIYGISIQIITYNSAILTESLSLSSMTVLIYLLACWLDCPSSLRAWEINLFLFFMVLLRPSYLCLVAVFTVFWIVYLLINKSTRKQALNGLLSIAFVISLLFGYCDMNYEKNNYFGLTDVATTNDICILIKEDMYKSEKYKSITNNISNYSAEKRRDFPMKIANNLKNTYSSNYLSSYASECKKIYREKYIKGFIKRVVNPKNSYIYFNYGNLLTNVSWGSMYMGITKVLMFPLGLSGQVAFILIFVLFEILMFLIFKKIDWLQTGLLSISLACILTAFLGAHAEYSRLCAPSLLACSLSFYRVIDNAYTFLPRLLKKKKLAT